MVPVEDLPLIVLVTTMAVLWGVQLGSGFLRARKPSGLATVVGILLMLASLSVFGYLIPMALRAVQPPEIADANAVTLSLFLGAAVIPVLMVLPYRISRRQSSAGAASL